MISTLAYGAAAAVGVPAKNIARKRRYASRDEEKEDEAEEIRAAQAPSRPMPSRKVHPAPAPADEKEAKGGKEIVAAGFNVGLAPAMRNGTAVMDDSTGASFQIFGADSQIVEVTLAPGASLLSQPGNLVHMDNCFEAKVKTGGLYPAFRRSRFGGESTSRLVPDRSSLARRRL